MKPVFDTNILIDYLAGKQPAKDELSRFPRARISIITWMEVMVGATGKDARRPVLIVGAWFAFPAHAARQRRRAHAAAGRVCAARGHRLLGQPGKEPAVPAGASKRARDGWRRHADDDAGRVAQGMSLAGHPSSRAGLRWITRQGPLHP